MSSAVANRRGILAMLAAMTLFTGNDTLLKVATAGLPPGEIMAIRGGFAVVLVLALIAIRGETRQLGGLHHPRVLARALTEAALSFMFITGLSQLPIANITAILQATPLVLTLLAVLLGIERVGWRRWCAVIVGFIGVLLIVKPSLSGMNPYAALALACAGLVAVRDLVTRTVAGAVPTAVITLSSTLAVTLCGLGLSAFEEWRMPHGPELTVLAVASVLVSLGNLAIVQAFRGSDISVVSPFRYSIILTSLAVGYVVFGEWPDLLSVFGTVLVVLSGLYTLHREQVRARRAAARLGVVSEAPPAHASAAPVSAGPRSRTLETVSPPAGPGDLP